MATGVRATMLSELVAEFAEERIRGRPAEAFGVAEVTRALGAALKDAGAGGEIKPDDATRIAALLDQHPFLVRAGKSGQWKPGLKKPAKTR